MEKGRRAGGRGAGVNPHPSRRTITRLTNPANSGQHAIIMHIGRYYFACIRFSIPLIQSALRDRGRPGRIVSNRKRCGAHFASQGTPMKKRVLVLSAILVLMLVSYAHGADINGTWGGSLEAGPQGAIDMSFLFKVDGEKLSGTMTDSMAGESKINEGALKGDDISFTVLSNSPLGEMTLIFKGKVTGADEIKLSFSLGGGQGGNPEMEITIKRVK